MISNDKRDRLNQFSNKVWGNAQAVLSRHDSESGGFEYIDVEECLDGLQFLFGPAVVPKILVRDEYRTALRELQTDLYDRGAYVTGHPGIGKTLFLIYLLVELLGQQCKVAVHDHDDQVYAFFTDTVDFYPLTDPTVLLEPHSYVWTLSHSSGRLQIPPSYFYCFAGQTRPIQSTLPIKERWRWSKHAWARCYIMDIWNEREITNLTHLFGFDAQRMIDLHRKWGGAPRTLLKYLDMPDHEIETLYRRSAGLAVTNSQTMTSSVLQSKLSENTMTQFYFCRPFYVGKPTCNRLLPCVVVPTPVICRILAEALQKLGDSITLDFFGALSTFGQPRQAARYIYKSWFHCFLSAGRSIDCYWSHCQAKPTSYGISTLIAARQNEAKDVQELPYNWVIPLRQARFTSLPRITSLILAGPDELRDVKKFPYYWVAPSKFPGIDGAFICQDAIFAVQVIVGGKYKPAEEGLEKLRNGLPPDLKNNAWYLVFVGNDDCAVRISASDQAGKIVLPTLEKDVTIGWSPVNPVEENIDFKISREDDYLREGELMEPVEDGEWSYH